MNGEVITDGIPISEKSLSSIQNFYFDREQRRDISDPNFQVSIFRPDIV